VPQRKRGNNEGTIYQRESDGKWVGALSLGYDGTGKRKRKIIYGDTRKEVRDRLLALQKAHADGLPVTKDTATIADLMTAWLAEVVKPTVRPKTYRSYEQISRVHIVPALGRIKVRELDARQIQAFLHGRTTCSPRTVGYIRGILRRALGQAMKWDWVTRNIVILTTPPKIERTPPPTFTVEQARALLAAFDAHRLGPLFTVQLGLGLRIGEALGLRWEDVRLDEGGHSGTLIVRYQLQRVAGVDTPGVSAYTLMPPKSRAGNRVIELPGFVAEALVKQRCWCEAMQPAWTKVEATNELGLVFTSGNATPLSDYNVRRDFKKLLVKAGIERIRLHDMRHLCASLLLAKGVPARVVMEILGHSQISLTMNTYSHVLPGTTSAAARAMEDALKRK
jgi:integrase